MGAIASGYIAKRMGPSQALWNSAVQNRVSVTSRALDMMKGIKMMGLTLPLSERIQSLRVHELELSKSFRRMIAWMNVNGNIDPPKTKARVLI